MKKIILWGTGEIANKLINVVEDQIVLVVDNNEEKWGSNWNGYIINSPQHLNDFKENFDRIIIATASWKEIRNQIYDNFNIALCLVDNMYYRQREALLEYYNDKEESDKKKYISYLRENPLVVFNDNFVVKYEKMNPIVYYDSSNSLYYLYHNRKKMYFSSEFNTEERVKKYYCSLLMEQDIASPHRYLTTDFHVSQHDIVLDAGVAEGNFALDVIDLVDKLYVVEADREWVKALEYTFAPYKDKVEIIEGFLGNSTQGSLTIDSIIENGKVDFIKMDIEGAEWESLCGAEQTLKQNDVKLDICVYHNYDDEEKIKLLLKKMGYKTEVSEGYMVFITEKFLEKEVVCPQFVHGLVRGKKGI